MIKYLIGFLLCFVISGLISPLVLKLCKKLKASQTILHYVEAHKDKQGTPTMGGFIFIIGTILSAFLILGKNYSLAIIALSSLVGYGALGFLDDFIKIRFHQNQGLKAYQKIIGQVGLAILFAFFAYNSANVGTSLIVPFTNTSINLGWAYIPFAVFLFIALTNSVNLLDGLDGLATGVSSVYLIGFLIIFANYVSALSGVNPAYIQEAENLIIVGACLAGGLVAFIILNGHPAQIFMGDTGSLAIGGFLSALAVFSRFALYVPILGLIYVLTAVSDILQVLHYKRTKKRIFLMAPLHHHFEKKGMNENKIVIVYIVISIIIFALTFLIDLLI